MMSDLEVGRAEMTFVWPDGRQVLSALTIDRPMPAVGGGWECRVSLEGFMAELPPMIGEDSLQALTRALGLGTRLLREFLADGGVLRDKEGTPLPLDAYFPPT